MKLVQEVKTTPTYKQYAGSTEYSEGSKHEVELVLVNPEWKTLTFFSDAFKLSFKYKTLAELNQSVKAVSKIISKPCKCWLEAESKVLANLHLNPASDADEEFATFESTERGWSRTR